MSRRWYLEIRTFGVLGQHFYASLKCPDQPSIKAEYRMDTQQADMFNRGDPTGMYKSGDVTSRFWTHAAAVRGAHVHWLNVKQEGDVLLYGPFGDASPLLIIDGLWHGDMAALNIRQQLYRDAYEDCLDEVADKHERLWDELLRSCMAP